MNSALSRSFFAGLAGLIGYGGWATFANYAHGVDIAIRAGVVQGTYSFVLTFAMTYVTEWLFGRLGASISGIVASVVLVCVILFSTAYGIHFIVGTPEILMTILPGFVIGTVYTSIYLFGLRKNLQRTIQA